MHAIQLHSSESSSTTSFQTQTSTTDFTSTASSLSTTPGPGALSGKAIRALGKAVLRGAESLVIRQKLLSISSRFPHTNAERFEGIDVVYKDLLELSRVNLYSDNVRSKAIKILLVQIGSQQTLHLLKALSEWPSVEIQLFVSDLVSILDPIRLCSEINTWADVLEAYRASLRVWESHSLAPLVEFLCEVAELRSNATQAVIQGGAMDFLFHAYVTGFRDPFRTNIWLDIDPMFLRTSANRLLLSLSADAAGFEQIRRHPLSLLWPTRNYIPFTTTDSREKDRLNVWLSCESDITYRMLLSTLDIMRLGSINYNNDFYDMFVDFMELAGSDSAGLRLSMRALRNLHWMSRQHRSYFRFCAIQHSSSRTMSHYVDILSQIISRIFCVSSLVSPETEFFLLPSDSKSRPPKYNLIVALLQSATAHEPILTALLASNVAALLRYILTLDVDPNDPHHDVWTKRRRSEFYSFLQRYDPAIDMASGRQ